MSDLKIALIILIQSLNHVEIKSNMENISYWIVTSLRVNKIYLEFPDLCLKRKENWIILKEILTHILIQLYYKLEKIKYIYIYIQ